MPMHDVYLLANLLRSSGDQVLNGESKLRLTPTLLHKLNTSFSQIAAQDTGPDFHVIPAHGSQLTQLSELDFLHDFVQKTPGLTISGVTVGEVPNRERLTAQQRRFSRNSGDGSILDLSRFRQLHHLEVRGGTIGSVAGISALRGHIRTLMLTRVGEGDFSGDDLLRTVLAGCMHFSTDAHKDAWWPALTQLVACYCQLQTIGPCLSLAPRLVVLDLSHNALVDESALASQLGVLLNLRYLNLSFNRLTCIPELRPELQYLVISHNHINYVDNVEHLTGLLELNLVMNHLTDHSQLKELTKMTSLHRLYLSGNPMSFHCQHRLRTCANLNKHTALVKFLLDGSPLSKREKEVVLLRKDDSTPTVSRDPVASLVTTSSEPSLHDSQRSLTQSFSQQQGSSEQRRNKRAKSVLITNAEEIAEKSTSERKLGLDKSSSVERIIPQNSQLMPLPIQSSTPKEPSPILTQAAQIMEERLLKMAPVRPAPPPPIAVRAIVNSSSRLLASATTPPNTPRSGRNDMADTGANGKPNDSITSKLNMTTEMTDDSVYETANESSTTVRMSSSVSSEPNEQPSKTIIQSIESEEELVDSDNEDAELRTYVGQLLVDDSSDPQEVFMTVSSRYIKELETDSLKVRERWPLAALMNCTSSEGNKLILTFKFRGTTSGISRVYIMEEKTAVKEVRDRLGRIISARDKSAINGLKVVQCMQCLAVFSQEKRVAISGNAFASSSIPEDPLKAINRCQWCKSDVLVEIDEKVMSDDGSPKPSKSKKTSKTELPTSNSVQHSESDSSIGSCASLGSCCDASILTSSDSISHPSALVRRCESDIDIISNPSQSSIEVLEDSNRSTPGRKRSSEERQVVAVPSLLPVPESNPHLAGLTESSSSGSMTDSVCTTYESGVASTVNRRPTSGTKHLPSNVLKEESSRENSPTAKDPESEQDPFNAILKNLLKVVDINTPENQNNAKTDLSKEQIHYDYENLACVDHSLKLHLYLSLLEEMDELQFIVRCELFIWSNSSHYDGFLVVSTKKVYLLKVTGPEDRDRIDSWLSRTHAIDRSKVRFITHLTWMAGVHMQLLDNVDIILLLRDVDRTKTLLKFSKDIGLPVKDIPDEDIQSATASVKKLLDQVEGKPEEHHLELLEYVCSMEIVDKNGEIQNKWDSGALHVGANVVVLTDDAVWSLVKVYSDLRPEAFKSRHSQLTSNLMKVSTRDYRLSLEFVDEAMEQQETWHIVAKTERSVAHVVNVLKLVWEPIFSVPLQVLEEHNDR